MTNEGGSIININSNQGGDGGQSISGDATGGDGGDFDRRGGHLNLGSLGSGFTFPTPPFGNGGDAHSGNAGNANGGSVTNIGSEGGTIFNENSSTWTLLLFCPWLAVCCLCLDERPHV